MIIVAGSISVHKGKAQALLALQSFSAWLLFATSAKECGADLSRKCLYEKAKAVTSWTAGGSS